MSRCLELRRALAVRRRIFLRFPLRGWHIRKVIPMPILFSIMGMSLSDIRSPQFLIAASIQLAELLISCATFHFYRRKHAAHENKIP